MIANKMGPGYCDDDEGSAEGYPAGVGRCYSDWIG
jgi:hypothetical protein